MLFILVHVLKLSLAAVIILPKIGVAHPTGLMFTLTQAGWSKWECGACRARNALTH